MKLPAHHFAPCPPPFTTPPQEQFIAFSNAKATFPPEKYDRLARLLVALVTFNRLGRSIQGGFFSLYFSAFGVWVHRLVAGRAVQGLPSFIDFNIYLLVIFDETLRLDYEYLFQFDLIWFGLIQFHSSLTIHMLYIFISARKFGCFRRVEKEKVGKHIFVFTFCVDGQWKPEIPPPKVHHFCQNMAIFDHLSCVLFH